MILRFLLYGFLIYFAFKLVFNFIIPVFKTTRQIKRQFNDINNSMQDQMSDQYNQQSPRDTARPQKVDKDDYTEFEDIREK